MRIQGLDTYANNLEAFAASVDDLPPRWLTQPDHVTIRCADALDYEGTLGVFTHIGAEAREVLFRNHRTATVRLMGHASVGSFGWVEWLEVVEPEPERPLPPEMLGIGHVGFFVPELGPGTSITLDIDAMGQEVRFAGYRLEDVARRHEQTGNSHPR